MAKVITVNPLNNPSPKLSTRELLGKLPAVLQHPLTWLTGVPLHGQKPLFRHTVASQYLVTLLRFLVGMLLTMATAMAMPWTLPLLPAGLLLVSGAARYIQVVLLHHIAHAPRTPRSRWLFELLSSLLLIPGYDAYRNDHLPQHHGNRFGSAKDPDYRFLARNGFLAGRRRRDLRRNLWRTLLSPRFHGTFLRDRLRANFVTVDGPRALLAALIHATLLAWVAWTGAWMVYLVAFLLPITVLYQASALLQVLTEHRWLTTTDRTQPARLRIGRGTYGRFSGEAPPLHADWRTLSGALLWARFWARMLLVHLPTRLFVLVGDMPQHDAHHRHPVSLDWPNAAYARQRDVEAGHPGWPEPYTETWGLGNALEETFRILESLPAEASEPDLAS